MSDCIFCKLATKEIPNEPVVETDYVFIIRDRAPVAKEHVLVIAKQHTANIIETPIDALSHVVHMAALYGKEHMPAGFRIVMNTGDDAGQTVKHFHAHVLGGEKLKDL